MERSINLKEELIKTTERAIVVAAFSLAILSKPLDKFAEWYVNNTQMPEIETILSVPKLNTREAAYSDLMNVFGEGPELVSKNVDAISLPYSLAIAIHEGWLARLYYNHEENKPINHFLDSDAGWMGINRDGAFRVYGYGYNWEDMNRLGPNSIVANRYLHALEGDNVLEIISQYHHGTVNKKDKVYPSIINAHAGIIASTLKKTGKWDPINIYGEEGYGNWYLREGQYLENYKEDVKKNQKFLLYKTREQRLVIK